MAVRRSSDQREEQDYGYDDGNDTRFIGDPNGGGSPLMGGGMGSGPRIDEFGNVVPDFSNDPNFPVPFQDYTPPEISGNTERGVDLKGPQGVPTTSRPAPPPMNLPMGVSTTDSQPQGTNVNDGMFSGVPNYGNTMETPQTSRTPSLASGSVSNAIPESGTNSGPMRRSAVSPSIYGDTTNPTMFGRADGLLGGGKGLVGAQETSGKLTPTDMMAKLVQLFKMRGQM